MDVANQVGGLVVGTGDLSELALGWATYNGDHMCMYHVNAGVPKTLVRYLIEWVADEEWSGEAAAVLRDIFATPITPELLPLGAGRRAGAEDRRHHRPLRAARLLPLPGGALPVPAGARSSSWPARLLPASMRRTTS